MQLSDLIAIVIPFQSISAVTYCICMVPRHCHVWFSLIKWPVRPLYCHYYRIAYSIWLCLIPDLLCSLLHLHDLLCLIHVIYNLTYSIMLMPDLSCPLLSLHDFVIPLTVIFLTYYTSCTTCSTLYWPHIICYASCMACMDWLCSMHESVFAVLYDL